MQCSIISDLSKNDLIWWSRKDDPSLQLLARSFHTQCFYFTNTIKKYSKLVAVRSWNFLPPKSKDKKNRAAVLMGWKNLTGQTWKKLSTELKRTIQLLRAQGKVFSSLAVGHIYGLLYGHPVHVAQQQKLAKVHPGKEYFHHSVGYWSTLFFHVI